MRLINVPHSAGSYEVRIAPGLLDQAETAGILHRKRAFIVTDENVARAWLPALQRALPGAPVHVLPAGEASKTLANLERIWEQLAREGIGRDAVLVALGGGVVGDMTGFAAACWMRGVDYVQIPTTLLAQVDASVGGKTAVDLPAGKNLVGAFHQPLAVLIDLDTLGTLPAREFAAGFAEVVKSALIADPGFPDFLEEHAAALLAREPALLEHAIARSCEIKRDIVARDERERGERMLLNLGHTFAHALESDSAYERWLHGEAVAIGLVLACALSERVLGLDPAVRTRVTRLLDAFGLPTRLPGETDPDALLARMRLDKKHRRNAWRLVLLETPAAAAVHEFADASPIRETLRAG